ncbi:Uridine kinase [Gurleya vavrai]
MNTKSKDQMHNVRLTPNQLVEMHNINSKLGINLYTYIQECFQGAFNSEKKYLIAIQGSSSSGKSTLAHNIYNMFMASGIECFLLQLDKFYKTSEDTSNIHDYDFDNPAALDWDKMHEVLFAIENDAEVIPTYEYSFVDKKCTGPIFVKNNKPKIIIVEGIYALNTVNEYVFNIPEMDPFNSKKNIEKEFLKNKRFYKNFKILKVKLTVCQRKSMEVRLSRDIIQRGKTKEGTLYQFYNQVWPATIKWVNNKIFKEDIKIIHGTFNEKKIQIFIAALSHYFTGEALALKEIKYDGNFYSKFNVECSGECKTGKTVKVVLDDN